MAHLMAGLGATRLAIDQCMFGQPSVTPTYLPTAHLPLLVATAWRYRCNGQHSHTVLQGRDDAGGWRTSPAKEYPPALCTWLASALHSAACARPGAVAPVTHHALLDGLGGMGLGQLYCPL